MSIDFDISYPPNRKQVNNLIRIKQIRCSRKPLNQSTQLSITSLFVSHTDRQILCQYPVTLNRLYVFSLLSTHTQYI